MSYDLWINEAGRTFNIFKNNKIFIDIINILKNNNIEIGTNATYYYYGKDESKVDTRRYIYYKNIGLFKVKIYTELKKTVVYFELIRRAELGNKRIQENKELFFNDNFRKIYKKGEYDVTSKDGLDKFEKDISNLIKDIESNLEMNKFNESDAPLKLKNITIYNFKNIKEAEIDFDENLQLLVGVNNAGKTSLIQGIVLSQIALNKLYNDKKIQFDKYGKTKMNSYDSLTSSEGVRIDKVPFTVENYRELFNVNSKSMQSVKFAKYEFQNNLKIELYMSLVGEYFSIKINYISGGIKSYKLYEFLEKNIILIPSFFNVTLNEERKSKGRYVSLMKSGNYNQLFRNILYDLKNIDNMDGPLEKEEKDSNINNKNTITRFNILTNKLEELFDIYGLDVKFDEEYDEFISAKYKIEEKEFDISSLGIGTLQFIQVVAQILLGNSFFIMLDEPDAHLNAKLQSDIIRFFDSLSKEYDINFLIATHSKDIINCVAPNQILILEDGNLSKITTDKNKYDLFNELGSNTEELIGLTIGKKLVFVEGIDDIEYIKCLCNRFRIDKEKHYKSINFIELNGRLGVLKNNLDKYINDEEWNNIDKIAVFDKDYRFQESQKKEEEKLCKKGFKAIGWDKKEFENYLIKKDLIIRTIKENYDCEITECQVDKLIDDYKKNIIETVKLEFENEFKKEKVDEIKFENEIKVKDIQLSKGDEVNIREKVIGYLEDNRCTDYLSGKEILNKIRCELIYKNNPKSSDFIKSLIYNIREEELDYKINELLNYIRNMAREIK